MPEYIGGFHLVIIKKNSQSVFKFLFYLSEFFFRGSLKFTIISSVSGNEFLDNALQGFGAEFFNWNYVVLHFNLLFAIISHFVQQFAAIANLNLVTLAESKRSATRSVSGTIPEAKRSGI